ncbi:hypothetical protein IKF84_01690 [Candidatus Saccharibacteria bacterium]|nr:hypothetical protein [Candidatus Saccharibacteria bacterium]
MNTSIGVSKAATSSSTRCPIALAPAGAAVSICPKGWTLPSKTQIDSLSGGSSSVYVSSFSPVLGGRYLNNTLLNDSTHGYQWGSTAYDGGSRYYLGYNSNNLFTYNGYRNVGYYIRCIQAS